MAALASYLLIHFPLVLWNRWTEYKDLKISRSSTKFVFFGLIRKTRWPPWPLIGWDIFDFFSEISEQNSKKLDRMLLNWLFNVTINDISVIYVTATWQEARSQRHLPSLCFSGRLEKQDGRPSLWLAETFSTSLLKLLNGIQRNLTGSKISTPNVPYQVCDFWADGKNKMAALASDWLRFFRLLLWNHVRNSTKLDKKHDINVLYQVCFLGQLVNINGCPGPSVKNIAHCTQVHDMWPFGPLVYFSLATT